MDLGRFGRLRGVLAVALFAAAVIGSIGSSRAAVAPLNAGGPTPPKHKKKPGKESDGDSLTLALKFVEFERDGRPVLSRDQAEKLVESMNAVYAQCDMRLKLEHYEQVDPGKFGLARRLSSPDEMDLVRTPFDSDRHLVIIHTGAWDHGPMGPANAWTAMPGQLPAGAVLEAPVADNGNITAHELGHYLGLDHAKDELELMNPIIYKRSVRITPTQCERMRQTAMQSRSGAIRQM